MKLCNKENMSLEERVNALENTIATGNFTVSAGARRPETASNMTKAQSTKSTQNVDSAPKKPASGESAKTGTSDVNSAEFWPNVINRLKEERKAMLFSNLNNTKAVLLDDMTVGIQFLNGLNSFGRAVIERPENMNELKKLVSLECGKDMRIKIVDKTDEKKEEDSSEKLDLGIDINYID